MANFKSYASCGFCEHYGEIYHGDSRDVCAECEARLIRERLEDILGMIKFEHDHKYRPDSDYSVHNCAHCEYADTEKTRYHAAQHYEDVACTYEEGISPRPLFKPSHRCDKWKRAADKRTSAEQRI